MLIIGQCECEHGFARNIDGQFWHPLSIAMLSLRSKEGKWHEGGPKSALLAARCRAFAGLLPRAAISCAAATRGGGCDRWISRAVRQSAEVLQLWLRMVVQAWSRKIATGFCLTPDSVQGRGHNRSVAERRRRRPFLKERPFLNSEFRLATELAVYSSEAATSQQRTLRTLPEQGSGRAVYLYLSRGGRLWGGSQQFLFLGRENFIDGGKKCA